MNRVRAKKHLGQHFLTDPNIAGKIVASLSDRNQYRHVLEVGPGMGILTRFLLKEKSFTTWVIDIDRESVAYLENEFPELRERIILGDFLKSDPESIPGNFAVIGNFPYNISSQILFKILQHRDRIPEVVGMFQKEVAERIASPPGNKSYGILSVLTRAFYDIEYLFTVHEHVFSPPPKVKSAVIKLSRNERKKLPCSEALFFNVVKTAFNQRRKMLRNALKPLLPGNAMHRFLSLRAEQLSVNDFIELTTYITESGKPEPRISAGARPEDMSQ